MATNCTLPEGWTAHEDTVSGKTFYSNAAGETAWDPPIGTIFHDAPAGLPPLGDEGWEEPLVNAVKKWFMETEMQALFESATEFADAHCEVFDPYLGEHKLEYTELHKQFRQLFEDKLNNFLASLGYSPEHFYLAFEKCIDRDAETKGMADIMWCCLDYEFFCQIMCERKRERLGNSGAN
mmetsp:Transcript_49769/g.105997  ORF Transcript_49769/g.105997 Transcript_49769/m.105997 type:complete len:180 (-) Transcript_49769:13-552(-)